MDDPTRFLATHWGIHDATVTPLDDAQVSRQEAERVLDAMARDLDVEVATLADVRSQVLVSEILAPSPPEAKSA